MRKKELIKALSKIEEGFADVKNLILAEDTANASADAKKGAKTPEKSEPVESIEDTVEGYLDRDELMDMKYNDLKKLGKELGVKCTGTREEIVEKILAVPVGVPVGDIENNEDPVEEKDNKVVLISNKKSAKKTVKAEEPTKDDSDEVEEQYLEMAREALEDNDLADIVEVLADAGIKLSKRLQAKQDVVMTKLAEAFQSGLIDVDDEDEETETQESNDADDSDFTEVIYFEQYDPEGHNDPEVMTKKRAKAVKEIVAGIIEAFNNEELTVEAMEEELEDIITEEESELLGEDYTEEDLLAFYIEMKKRFIDNDGNVAEIKEPIEIGESNFCCGHELRYDKKGKKYICDVCGEEYEEQ